MPPPQFLAAVRDSFGHQQAYGIRDQNATSPTLPNPEFSGEPFQWHQDYMVDDNAKACQGFCLDDLFIVSNIIQINVNSSSKMLCTRLIR